MIDQPARSAMHHERVQYLPRPRDDVPTHKRSIYDRLIPPHRVMLQSRQIATLRARRSRQARNLTRPPTADVRTGTGGDLRLVRRTPK